MHHTVQASKAPSSKNAGIVALFLVGCVIGLLFFGKLILLAAIIFLIWKFPRQCHAALYAVGRVAFSMLFAFSVAGMNYLNNHPPPHQK